MDLVPDSVGRDNSGSDGFPFRNALPARDAAPLNGAAHRKHDAGNVEEVAASTIGDPTIADHPLVQGLLVELPERDSALPEGWLDRWLEAARAVMELLYAQRPTSSRP
ncbi:MAG: hypothetical protein WCA46_27675 [Actinocatenispora sp.]